MKHLTHRIIVRLRRIVCLFGVLIAQTAVAQGLNLGSPIVPRPGDGVRALELAQQLADRAESLRRGHGNARDQRQLLAQSAIRSVAAELLRSGEGAGIDGAAAVLAGVTIANNLPAFDELLTDHLVRIDDAALELIAAGAPGNGAYDAIARTPGRIDAVLAGFFAPLCAEVLDTSIQHGGWWGVETKSTALSPESGAQPDAQIIAWQTAGSIDTSTADAVRAFAGFREQALFHPGSLSQWQAMWMHIATVVDALPDIQARFGKDTSDQTTSRVANIAISLADPSADIALFQHARDQLETTAWAVRKWKQLESSLSNASNRSLRDTFRALVTCEVALGASQPTAGTSTLSPDTRRNIEAVSTLLTIPVTLPSEDRLVRQLRPARRTLAKELNTSTDQLARLLPDVYSGKTTQADPALLAAMQTQRELIGMMRLLAASSHTLSGFVTDSGTVAAAPMWTRLADHALKLSQDMDKRDDADDARKKFRQMLLDLTRFGLLPGEDTLNQSSDTIDTSWGALTKNRHRELLALLPSARTEWMDAVGRQSAEAEALRLDALAEMMDVLASAVRVADAINWQQPGTARQSRVMWIEHWAGWSLSTDALDRLLDDLQPDLQQLVDLAIDADPYDAMDKAKDIRQTHAVVLLAGELDSVAALHVGRSPPEVHPASLNRLPSQIRPLIELSFGPPQTDAWLIEYRTDIANACRYAEEYAARPAADNTAERMRSFAAGRAAVVLDVIRTRRKPEG